MKREAGTITIEFRELEDALASLVPELRRNLFQMDNENIPMVARSISIPRLATIYGVRVEYIPPQEGKP